MANPFDDIARELPDGKFWPTGRLFKRLIAAIVADRVRPGNNVDEIPSDQGRFFNAQTGGSSTVAPAKYLWEAYAAPWTGTGPAPADWGLNLMIRPGDVNDGTGEWEPANLDAVIKVPPNCTTGYRVWLKASVSAAAKFTSLVYDHGLTLPAPVDTVIDSTGTPPVAAYCHLFTVTSSATAVDFANVIQKQSTSLVFLPVVTNQALDGIERRGYFLAGTLAALTQT